MSLSPATMSALNDVRLDQQYVEALARLTLAEDLGDAEGIDITTVATVEPDARAQGRLVARAGGVVAGLPVAAAVFDMAAERNRAEAGDEKSGVDLSFQPQVDDGAAVLSEDVIAIVEGQARAILTAERSALNLLCRASGVATHTFLWAQALVGTNAKILDTRKTTPGLRAFEKYAVRCGGGTNKRMGLFDVAMIKDNHIAAAGSISKAFARIQESFPGIPIQVEVRSFEEADEAIAAGARFLLCDNMSIDALRELVAAVRKTAGDAIELEATGGLTLENARDYGETGVDYLSVGALTHSSPIVDIALDLS